MRISDFQREVIVETLKTHFGSSSQIYLFGSRTDDSKKGGDIDLFVEADYPEPDLFMRKLKAVSQIQLALGDQKIDLIVSRSAEDDQRRVVKEAINNGVKL